MNPAPLPSRRIAAAYGLCAAPASPKDAYENSFYFQVIRGISQVCNQRQVACSVITGKDTAEMLQALQAMSQSRQNDGFILLYSRKDDPVVDYLCEQGLLYVLVGKEEKGSGQTICMPVEEATLGCYERRCGTAR